MTWPTPRVGQVIRYAYLWKREADAGLEEGLKDRPVVIVVAQRREGGRIRVVVAPITLTSPIETGIAIETPPATRRRLGLDDEPQWIVLNDLNAFLWPGPDLRPVPGQGPGSLVVGFVPGDLMRVINERLRERIRASLVAITNRSET